MCNLTDVMKEESMSMNNMTQEEILETMFYQEEEEYLIQYFKDLEESMKEMEVEDVK